MPDYEEYMCDHLRKVTGIFVRESATVEYLESIGVAENVYPVADPAFLMEPIKPAGIEREMPLDEEAIGINLSPLMAKFVTGGDLERWTKVAASIILKVAETTEMPVYLIPHVTSPHSDDSSFMQRVVSLIQRKNENIALLSSKYTASETKWIISQMAVFAGSRTHATIAALSSGVPTMSFGYSIKARGINRDIFGHTRYCLGPMDLEAETVTDRIISMCDDGQKIRMELQYRIPEVQKSALHAGSGLRRIVEENIHAQSIGCHPPL
jgi:polysaccharide pyruvyl transferase WcaK-like protein